MIDRIQQFSIRLFAIFYLGAVFKLSLWNDLLKSMKKLKPLLRQLKPQHSSEHFNTLETGVDLTSTILTFTSPNNHFLPHKYNYCNIQNPIFQHEN
ncbi:hypothetical protein BpHYR1_048701 [Brachionus plicatilis]|uniref:Uncharacterized protein n=1 Tax=Brachionus plicatilis TaxID=10195 RepID=A0A3M7S4U2_BRAPC|nr:hypothetical protein BpHYR1_048701 [Brachionus plicatilis]